MRKFLFTILFLFIGTLSYSQTVFTQTYVDRCTGEVQVVVANFVSGSATVAFYNKMQTFTYQQFLNGELHQWLNETYEWWYNLSPCSTATTETQQAQQTASTATQAAQTAATAASSVSVPTTTVPTTTTAPTVAETPLVETTVAPTTTETTAPNTTTNDTSTQNTTGDTPTSSEPAPTESTGNSDTGSSDGGQTSDSPSDSGDGGGESTGSSEDSGETTTEETKTEESSSEETKSEETKEEVKEESKEETKEESKEESKDEESSEEKSEEEKKEEKEKEKEEKKKEKEKKKEEKKKASKLLPIQLRSDTMANQALLGNYDVVTSVGASQSSIYGDETYGATAMIYSNLKQFSLSTSYTKVKLEKFDLVTLPHEGHVHYSTTSVVSDTDEIRPPTPGVKIITSASLGYSNNFGNGSVVASLMKIKPMGKFGTVGFGMNMITIFGEGKYQMNMVGYNVLYTNMITLTPRIQYAPAMIWTQSPYMGRYDLVNMLKGTRINGMVILANSFTVKLTRRFSFNAGATFIKSTDANMPLIKSFMIGTKLPF